MSAKRTAGKSAKGPAKKVVAKATSKRAKKPAKKAGAKPPKKIAKSGKRAKRVATKKTKPQAARGGRGQPSYEKCRPTGKTTMSDNEIKSLFEMTAEELIERFAHDASAWACHGVGMLRSAYVVWQVFWERMKGNYQRAKHGEKLTPASFLDGTTDRFVHAYKLLAACAMENLAKGLVIAKGKLSIQDHKLPNWFVNHDIVSLLSQQVGFQLNDDERRALTDSKNAIIWQTRYPMPKAATHLPRKWPGMEFGQRFNHPIDFRDLAIRMLRDYPDEAFPMAASDLIKVLEIECPEPEDLNS